MNKRGTTSNKTGVLISIIKNIDNIPTSEKPIYIVRCEEVHYIPAYSTSRRFIYNIMVCDNFEKAREFTNIVNDNIRNTFSNDITFKELFSVENTDEDKYGINRILYKITTKFMEINPNNTGNETYSFTLLVEEVKTVCNSKD